MNTPALRTLRGSLSTLGITSYVLQDPGVIQHLTGLTGYLGMDFGRPTLLIVDSKDEPVIVTPACEAEMVRRAVPNSAVKPWTDAVGWWPVLKDVLPGDGRLGVERPHTHPQVMARMELETGSGGVVDCTRTLDALREVKTAGELAKMEKAGQVAIAILDGCRHAVREGVPEWEVALAATAAGSTKAASLMAEEVASGGNALLPGESPLVCSLPIMQSAPPRCPVHEDHMQCVHQRASLRTLRKGDAMYLCCCNLAEYRGMHLGFDRTFFLGGISDPLRRLHDVCLASQGAALEAIRPGVVCEDVHNAAVRVLGANGMEPAYRTGRSVGYRVLETPELRGGDRTVLQEGMCFAVDGAVSLPGVGTVRIGDSIRVTATGYEYLTPYEKGPIVLPLV